jgi:hypothetical protein
MILAHDQVTAAVRPRRRAGTIGLGPAKRVESLDERHLDAEGRSPRALAQR